MHNKPDVVTGDDVTSVERADGSKYREKRHRRRQKELNYNMQGRWSPFVLQSGQSADCHDGSRNNGYLVLHYLDNCWVAGTEQMSLAACFSRD